MKTSDDAVSGRGRAGGGRDASVVGIELDSLEEREQAQHTGHERRRHRNQLVHSVRLTSIALVRRASWLHPMLHRPLEELLDRDPVAADE